jgi:cell division protein FtsB
MKIKERIVWVFGFPYTKYAIVSIAFVAWIVFFDDNNLRQRQANKEELFQLKEQLSFYKHKIEADKRKLIELQTNDENLEKFAREQFLMKKSNEDLFLIVEE